MGNTLTMTDSIRFAIPDFPAPNDLIINELLSDPQDGAEDFVEIFNRSQKVIDLRDVRISNYDTVNLVLTSIKTIAPLGYLIFPGEYLALSVDPEGLKLQYYTSNPKGFVRMESMPSFNIDGSTAVISDSLHNIIYLFTICYFHKLTVN